MTDAAPTPEQLWQDAVHAIGRPLAHEVRNVLNGLAVNLEVVRSRAAKPDAPAAPLARFAETASEQLEVLTSLTEGLLSLVRPAGAAELGALVERIGALLRAVARPDGGDVLVVVDAATTSLEGAELRPVVAALLVAAFDRAAALSCEVTGGDAPVLRLARVDGVLPALPDDVRLAVERAGVRLALRPEGWTARFPGPLAAQADSHLSGTTQA